MTGAGLAELVADLVVAFTRRGRVPKAQRRRVRLNVDLATGLGVDEREQARCRQLVLTPVDHLDREHLVRERETGEGTVPLAAIEEVGDDDHEPASRMCTLECRQGRREVSALARR